MDTEIVNMLPMIFGAVAVLLNCIAYCITKTLTYRRGRPSLLCCAAWSSILTCVLLLASGGCSIWLSVKCHLMGWTTWIGFFVVLSGMYWMVQAMKYHKMAKTQSAGYQPFNHNEAAERRGQQPQRRRSNAPLIVEVDSNNPGISIEHNLSSSVSPMSSAAKSNKSRFSQPLIRNAVPPSPFLGTQGTDSYVAIPMSITKSTVPRSGCTTPQGMSPGPTLGKLPQEEEEENEPMNDTLTEPQAEDSIDEEDGKQEVEDETPRGSPERKTSEGNDTMC